MRAGTIAVCAAAILLAAGAAQAAITIATVPVGDPGNAGELSGAGAGGYGPDRICGAVGYTYNIGKYEVTAGQYCAFLNAVAKTDTYGLYVYSMDGSPYGCQITQHGTSGSYTYDFSGRPSGTEADWANRPVNFVSYWDSFRFANWLSNGQPTGAQGPLTTERGTYTLDGYDGWDGRTIQRNPGATWAVSSEDEWYKAAYYKGGGTNAGYWDYPTSSNTAPGRDMADASGNNANYYTTGYLLGSPYYRTEVGEFQNSDSPYGTFDQGGNVWEWNEAIVYQGSDYAYRGLRGGSFIFYDSILQASNRYYSYTEDEDYYFGFRVSQVPEPATMAILAVGGLAMMRRRRK